MAGIGAEGASGLASLQAMLRQRALDQIAAEQRAKVDAQQQFQNSLDTRRVDLTDQQRHDALAEKATEQQNLNSDRQFKETQSINESMPPDTLVSGNAPIAGRLLAIGALRPKGIELAPPPMLAANPNDSAELPGTVENSPSVTGRSYRKNATQKQIDTNTDNARQADALKQTGETQDWRNSIAQQLADLKGAQPPHQPTPHYQLQPELDPKTGQQTGRFLGFNTLTNAWEPVHGQGPASTKPAPGAAAAATEGRAKSDALDTLSQLDQAIESAKSLIGPGQGRISNLEQMAGSADPRIQALGVKMKAAKMRVDHAITGSLRAGASPTLIQQWDNILANKVTPEGLKAGVQAMREIIGGNAPADSGGEWVDIGGGIKIRKK